MRRTSDVLTGAISERRRRSAFRLEREVAGAHFEPVDVTDGGNLHLSEVSRTLQKKIRATPARAQTDPADGYNPMPRPFDDLELDAAPPFDELKHAAAPL